MSAPKLAIIHTTPVTVNTLKALAAEILPDHEVINFVDDSILPQLKANGGDTSEVEERLIQYMKYAEEAGATVILNACSSVGEVVHKAQAQLHVPVVRIDEAMAETAVQKAAAGQRRIGVVATLETTLSPTKTLVTRKAAEAEGDFEIKPVLVAEAFERLMAGDPEGHDRVLAEALLKLVDDVDVVVLAQASMARVVETLPPALQSRFLSSPRLGVERVKAVVG